jgi:hypothetical protein
VKPRRPILTTTATLSLLLAAAIAFLWPRTHHTKDSLTYETASGNCYDISTAPGAISFHRSTNAFETSALLPDELRLNPGWSLRAIKWNSSFSAKVAPLPPISPPTTSQGVRTSITTYEAYEVFVIAPPAQGQAGFFWQNQTVRWSQPFTPKPVQSRQTTLILPMWFILVLLALSPLLLLRHLYSKQKLARLGLCPSCGYDLRATPHRCPECGRLTT